MGDMPNYFENSDQAFTKSFIEVPDWAKATRAQTVSLGPSGPVAPEDLVDAAGRCAPEVAKAAPPAAEPAPAAPAPEPVAQAAPAAPASPPATPAAPPAYGSVAGDLASARMPMGPPPAAQPAVKPIPVAAKPAANPDRMDRLQPDGGNFGGLTSTGGVALSMSECQVVRRAGQPSSVSISAGAKGARKVVVTYLAGNFPGIYTFDSGRLKEIDEVPQAQKPAKAVAKKKIKKKPAPKTATTERMFVQ